MTFKEWWGENEPHLNKETEELITRLEEIYAEHIEKKKNEVLNEPILQL